MADFGELCPLFSTGVYNEVHLGVYALSTYYTSVTLTQNILTVPGLPASNPGSLRFGRTIVITGWYIKRQNAQNNSVSVNLHLGRRTGSGTAAASIFGTVTLSDAVTTFPDIAKAWQGGVISTSMTLHTADCLNISNSVGEDDCPTVEVIIQYREK